MYNPNRMHVKSTPLYPQARSAFMCREKSDRGDSHTSDQTSKQESMRPGFGHAWHAIKRQGIIYPALFRRSTPEILPVMFYVAQ